MKCDIDHELITFASKDCPLCRLRDDALDVANQFEQLMCELEEIVRPTKKIKVKKSGKSVKVKAKKSGKLLHFPQPKDVQTQPDGLA